jgi:hypothetical protein
VPTTSTTIVPTTPTTINCENISCAVDCATPCGWSKNQGKCILGAKTTESERIDNLCVSPVGPGSCPDSSAQCDLVKAFGLCLHDIDLFYLCQSTCTDATCTDKSQFDFHSCDDYCAQSTCASECTQPGCGWSSKHNVCKPGANTNAKELANDACSCASITCPARCSGGCGWSKQQDKCAKGKRTTTAEANSKQCDPLPCCTLNSTHIQLLNSIQSPVVTLSDSQCQSLCTCPLGTGWSSKKFRCAAGGKTTKKERAMCTCP